MEKGRNDNNNNNGDLLFLCTRHLANYLILSILFNSYNTR